MDMFEGKGLSPMLINERAEPFDDPDWMYEIKWDGLRCLAYLSSGGTDLRNKRNVGLSPFFPELQTIHEAARGKCILDGELLILANDKPSFEKLQSRAVMTNSNRISMLAEILPASYIAFDILYLDGKDLSQLPLVERKKVLSDTVAGNNRISISGVFDQGVDLFHLTTDQKLEGIVAKLRNSTYHFGSDLPTGSKPRTMRRKISSRVGTLRRARTSA